MGVADEFAALVPEASVIVCAQVAVFGPCLAVARAWWPSHKDPWALADTIASLVLYPLLMWHAFRGVIELRHNVESRWFGISDASRLFQVLYVTRCTLHLVVLCMQRLSRRDLLLMLIHHVLSIAAFSGALLLRNCHYWACLCGCCEVTNIFLNNVWLFREITVKGLRLKEILPRLYVVNGLFLWISYLVFRILLFSYWLYAWYSDTTSARELTWERISNYERYFYAAVTAFLLVVSTFWFYPITKGLLKALMGAPETSKAKSQ